MNEIRPTMKRRVVRGAGKVFGVPGLADRVDELERQVADFKALSVRHAELMEVMEQLLLPVAQRDEEALARAIERYSDELDS